MHYLFFIDIVSLIEINYSSFRNLDDDEEES
jgi:hypothetical protein